MTCAVIEMKDFAEVMLMGYWLPGQEQCLSCYLSCDQRGISASMQACIFGQRALFHNIAARRHVLSVNALSEL